MIVYAIWYILISYNVLVSRSIGQTVASFECLVCTDYPFLNILCNRYRTARHRHEVAYKRAWSRRKFLYSDYSEFRSSPSNNMTSLTQFLILFIAVVTFGEVVDMHPDSNSPDGKFLNLFLFRRNCIDNVIINKKNILQL